jgi:tRNA A-37 threonylcarbamoyl transferase component Bud32/tetratricopeptide (TPR) repeat protein/TolB-like protein
MTDDARWTRLMELFDRAREHAPADRSAWLVAACPDDLNLRADVERMLMADSREEGILDRPFGVPQPEPLPVLAAELSDRYELERELGEGGMARVFLAHECKHGRPVVLKVLKPDVARHFGHERFLREVRIVAKLAHPHIVGLIDSGEAGGLLYYVMPYLQGETLRERIKATGPLPIPLTITLLRDVAAALGHAHRAGVVHRDLKPGNILLVGDHAFLLDFGIAKLLEPIRGEGPPTESGGAIGTPAYMAPEQRVADPALDHRADLYTWGVVAYECLTGRLPDNQILGISAEDVADRRPETPPALARLVAATLSPSAADRPKDADQLLRALEGRLSTAAAAVTGGGRWPRWRLVATALLVLLTAAGAVFAVKDRSAAQPGVRDPIAVGAFTNETGDPALDAWGRLAGDWITEGLHTMGPLAVIPWPTSLKASELMQDRRKAARPVDPVAVLREETGAGTVITGSYYRVGDSLQFHAEVADAVAGQVLASLAPVAAPIGSPEAAISELRRRVMGMIALSRDSRVSPAARLARRPPTFEAYQAFDRGLTLLRHQDYQEALPEFLRAFALDSEFVSSLLYAATASWNQGAFPLTDSLLRQVRIRRASLNDFWGMRLEALEARMTGDGQAELAVLRRAAASAPHSLLVYNLADAALNTDHPEEALEALKTLDTDRGDMRDWAPYWYNLTHAYHLLGQRTEELAAARQLRLRFPDRRAGLVFEVRALAAAGDTAGVDELLRAGLLLPPNTYWSQGAALTVAGEELQAHGFGQSGWRYLTQAVSWLDRQLALTPGDRAHRYWLASALYDLGDWHRAYRVSLDLATEYPDRLSYRGLAAVAAARLGLRTADSLIGSPRPHERGATALLKARIASIRADPEAALGLYSEATELGLEGLPWIHASAAYDLFLLGAARSRLPFSLRAGLNPPSAAKGGR